MSNHTIPLWVFLCVPFIFSYAIIKKYPLFSGVVVFILGFAIGYWVWG